MAQIYGQLNVPGQPKQWVPLSVLNNNGEFVIKTAIVSGIAKHYNGTGELTEAIITFANVSQSIRIYNEHTTQTLQASFDNGVNYFDILPGKDLKINASHLSIKIKATGAGTTYQILTVE